jgi:hypothetical protein
MLVRSCKGSVNRSARELDLSKGAREISDIPTAREISVSLKKLLNSAYMCIKFSINVYYF